MPRLRLWIAGRPGRSSRGLAYNHYVSKPIRVENWRAALAGVFLFGVALTHRLYGGFKMKVSLIKGDQALPLELRINRVYCIGYAGRNQAKVREHIDELAKIGVSAPPRTPTVYPVSTYLLTDAPTIMAQGKETSGEVEFVLFLQGRQDVRQCRQRPDGSRS